MQINLGITTNKMIKIEYRILITIYGSSRNFRPLSELKYFGIHLQKSFYYQMNFCYPLKN